MAGTDLNLRRHLARFAIVGACLAVAACGSEEAPKISAEERAGIEARAVSRMPSDPALAEIYEYSCYSCHGDPGNEAPLSGDVAAWEGRLAKGMDVLLESTINGYEGMPPLGMCMDCSADQFEALIAFMAGLED